MEIIKGILLLFGALALFSLFSMKMPKGRLAMSGMANTAVATFLVEAIHKYISGDLLGISFLEEVGASAGSLGAVAAVIFVGLSMKLNPIYAVAGGVAAMGYGILPGFIAGYVLGFVGPYIEKKLPQGLDVIAGVLLIAPMARAITMFTDPLVTGVLTQIGDMISVAAEQSPLLMGFILGGLIKMICTSPLSSMALTAMLGLQGLAMGIASIACVGGSFTNGIIFKKMGFGDKGNVLAVMLEPLTQAETITANPIPIYSSNFFGGALSGVAAAYFGIINNAPGTAAPIPGLLAPFGFNPAVNVIMAILFAVVGGVLSGYIGGMFFNIPHVKKRFVFATEGA